MYHRVRRVDGSWTAAAPIGQPAAVWNLAMTATGRAAGGVELHRSAPGDGYLVG